MDSMMPEYLAPRSNNSATGLGLLQTKLMAPPVRGGLVARPRLVERLHQGRTLPLNLVVAPAGFGKTTAVSAWLAETATQAVWVSLDAEDNDPIRFWLYLSTACERFTAGCSEAAISLLQSPQTVPLQVIVASLINGLALLSGGSSHERPFVLILDDYQFIENPVIHEAVSLFIERLPPQVHIVITSRIDPPLPLGRLRVRGLVNELRAADLRCSEAEGSLVVQQTTGLSLSPQAVHALLTRTEGWLAGLHLAGLALQHQADPEAFVQAFAGSHEYVVDYLLDEVFGQLTPETQRFLLCTSIIEHLSGPLCDALMYDWLERPSQQVLVELVRNNAFVISLDTQQAWFRYHHLFADVLRTRAREEYSAQLPELHRRASRWYANQGAAFLDLAVQHAVAGLDSEFAEHLICREAEELLITGQFALLIRLIKLLPHAAIEQNAMLSILLARGYYGYAQPEYLPRCLDDVRQALAQHPHPEQVQIERWMAALECHLLRINLHYHEAVELSRQVLAELPDEDLQLGAFVAFCLALSLNMVGELRSSIEHYEFCISVFEQHDWFQAIVTRCLLGRLLHSLGLSDQAIFCYNQAVQRSQQRVLGSVVQLPVAGWAMIGLGEIAYAHGDLLEAARLIHAGVHLVEQGGVRDAQPFGYVAQALVHQALGQAEEAMQACQRFQRFVQQEFPLPIAIDWANTLQAALDLRQGRYQQALQWAEQSYIQKGNLFISRVFEQLTYLRILISHQQFDLALPFLNDLLALAEQAEDREQAFQLYLLKAVAEGMQGNFGAAQNSLATADALNRNGQFQQHQRDEAVLLDHLQQLLAQNQSSEPDQHILQANEQLAEPLTARELEILQYIAEGLSNQEIAKILVLSVGTVKTHLHNVYGKLDARDRTHAVARARQLGLLS
jgi:LuxR family maltose regulon positive regulatory protein